MKQQASTTVFDHSPCLVTLVGYLAIIFFHSFFFFFLFFSSSSSYNSFSLFLSLSPSPPLFFSFLFSLFFQNRSPFFFFFLRLPPASSFFFIYRHQQQVWCGHQRVPDIPAGRHQVSQPRSAAAAKAARSIQPGLLFPHHHERLCVSLPPRLGQVHSGSCLFDNFRILFCILGHHFSAVIFLMFTMIIFCFLFLSACLRRMDDVFGVAQAGAFVCVEQAHGPETWPHRIHRHSQAQANGACQAGKSQSSLVIVFPQF